MADEFRTTITVEVAPEAVWKALTERTVAGDGADEGVHYVLPGFPSFEPLPLAGASCTPLEVAPGKLLRVRKDHEPCKGTEIAVQLEQEGTGTRITLVQSGFGALLDIVGRDVVFGHGREIAEDLALFLEHGLIVPGSTWGMSLGATTVQRPFALEVAHVMPGGFAEQAGLAPGDLLLSLHGVRVRDTRQLATVLAMLSAGTESEVCYIRSRELATGAATF